MRLSKFRTLAQVLHCYQYAALDRKRVAYDDIEHAVKVGVLKLLVVPFAGLVAVPLFFQGVLGENGAKVLAIVLVLLLVFGVSAFTDRIYDQESASIKIRAYRILDDPERGREWAQRKIVAIVSLQILALFVLAGLGRFLFIYGTGEPFFVV